MQSLAQGSLGQALVLGHALGGRVGGSESSGAPMCALGLPISTSSSALRLSQEGHGMARAVAVGRSIGPGSTVQPLGADGDELILEVGQEPILDS